MNRIKVNSKIGFDDAELQSYCKNGDTLTINICAWNGSQVKIHFDDVIRILDNDLNTISGIFEVIDKDLFLQLALERLYEIAPPTDNPYKHYQVSDIDGVVALEVVSRSIKIEYPPESHNITITSL